MRLLAEMVKLSMGDMEGGTFSITNGGVFGSLMSTPILNPPQSLFLVCIKLRSDSEAIDGKVEIRPMMYLALSYDHRIIDGKESVSFLVAVKDMLENPEKLLLGTDPVDLLLGMVMYRYLWSIVILCCLAACQSDLDKKISQLQEVELIIPENPFNRDSALTFVAKQVDFGPRVPNLPSHVHCASYLTDKLSSYGLNVEEQKAEVENYRGDTLSLQNIIAQYKPKHKTRIAIVSHWDTRPYADRETDLTQQEMLPDGANDGGSGTAIMLEIARLTQDRCRSGY